jgi:hypothetical protein
MDGQIADPTLGTWERSMPLPGVQRISVVRTMNEMKFTGAFKGPILLVVALMMIHGVITLAADQPPVLFSPADNPAPGSTESKDQKKIGTLNKNRASHDP